MADFRLVSVDIGLNALGWATWPKTRSRIPQPPERAGVLSVPGRVRLAFRDDRWHERVDWLMEQFQKLIFDASWGKPRVLALEWPEFRSGSALGLAAAGRDDLTHLAYCAGAHAEMARSYKCAVELVRVSTWKGMLKKDVVNKRIKRAIGDEDRLGAPFKTHAWDAVGIGLHVMGHRLDSEAFASRRST